MSSLPVIARPARVLHSQQFLVLLERHEVDGGVGDDPGEGGGVAPPEGEETLRPIAVPEPSDGVPEPVVTSLIGLEEYLGSETLSHYYLLSPAAGVIHLSRGAITVLATPPAMPPAARLVRILPLVLRGLLCVLLSASWLQLSLDILYGSYLSALS